MKTLSFVLVFYVLSANISCDDPTSYRNRTRKIQDSSSGTGRNGNVVVPRSPFGYIRNGSYVPDVVSSDFGDVNLQKGLMGGLTPTVSGEEKGKLCLQNVDKCIAEDDEYRATTDRLSKFLFTSTPPFDLSETPGVSSTCREQSKQYLKDLAKFKLWALRMYDSSAKMPSGILNGNLNQLGDFDLCHLANNEDINAQYCLASMQIEVPNSPYLAALHRLVQSHFHFRSQLEDPGHRVPRFSSINWALCVPSSCSAKDVELGLRTQVDGLIKGTEFEVQVEVKSQMCQSSQKKEIPVSSIIAMAFFVGIILAVFGAAIYDYYAVGKKNDWIMAFSLRKNAKHLMSLKRSAGDIEAIHGIRFLNAALLVMAHKCMAVFFLPYTNRTEMVETVGQPWSVIGRAASLYTDPFIMISGTLTTYALWGKLQRHGRINVFEEYASRMLRIVPSFAALIAFCTFVLPWINSGPMWNQVVTQHADICKHNWWRNLMFIHNYFGFEDMCLTHTHHVGIDTQLFFASPFFVLVLWKWPVRKGAAVLAAVALASTAMRYYVTYTMKLSNYVHFGTSIKQLFETADNMYILPVHRATVYIMGVFLGYLLRNHKHTVLSKTQLRFGNTAAVLCFLASFFGPAFMGKIDYVYSPTDAAWYAAFAPILWCFSFAWLIFTTHLGHRGFFEQFFAWRGWTVWTRISYSVYLTQFPVFFYNVGTARTSEHYGFFRAMAHFKEYFWIGVCTVALTLLFELPFHNVRDLMFGNSKELTKKRKSEQETDKEVEKAKVL